MSITIAYREPRADTDMPRDALDDTAEPGWTSKDKLKESLNSEYSSPDSSRATRSAATPFSEPKFTREGCPFARGSW